MGYTNSKIQFPDKTGESTDTTQNENNRETMYKKSQDNKSKIGEILTGTHLVAVLEISCLFISIAAIIVLISQVIAALGFDYRLPKMWSNVSLIVLMAAIGYFSSWIAVKTILKFGVSAAISMLERLFSNNNSNSEHPNDERIQRITNHVREQIVSQCLEQLKSRIPLADAASRSAKAMTNLLGNVLSVNVPNPKDVMRDKIMEIIEDIDYQRIVSEAIKKEFPDDIKNTDTCCKTTNGEFHKMVNDVAAEHLESIQVLGFFLGGIIGLLQIAL